MESRSNNMPAKSRTQTEHEPERDDERGEKHDETTGAAPSTQALLDLAKRLGCDDIDEDFLDSLRDYDDNVDVTRLVELAAPVLARFRALNPRAKFASQIANDLRREQPTTAEEVAADILYYDVEQRLVVPTEFAKQAKPKKDTAEEARLHREAYERDRLDSIANRLKPDDRNPQRAAYAVEVIDAFCQSNPKFYMSADFYTRLGEAMQSSSAMSKIEVARAFEGLFPNLTIPASVDPEGATHQRKQEEQAQEEREAREREKDGAEKEVHAAQASLRTPQQRERASQLVKGAQSLHGELSWCPSGPETGPIEGSEREWYQKNGVNMPKDEMGQQDPRVIQETGKDKHEVVNAFADWLRRDKRYDPSYQGEPAPEPPMSSFMNCWEAVFFAAFRAGLIDKPRLIDIYLKAKQSGDLNHGLMVALGWERATVFKRGVREPEPGDILFAGKDEHVAIYKGDGQYLQLWHDGRAREDYGYVKEAEHRESAWVELEMGYAIKFAPSPF